MTKTTRITGLLASVSLVVLLSACALTPEPYSKAEFQAKGAKDRAAMFKDVAPITKPLTLADAIARVLHYNLDQRSKMMESALALGQLDLDSYDLLPKLVASAGYENRSDHATTLSRDAVTLQPSLADPSYSLDRDRRVADLTASWNVLDFGVSWYTAKQNADRALMAEERRRKTVANLIAEVRSAYWRAAAAQTLAEPVKQAIAIGEKGLADAEKVEDEKLKNPLESLRQQKTLLENLRQLEGVQQELVTARAELAALINVAPNDPFTLALPAGGDMAAPSWDMPVEQMEEEAFTNNPDLREQVYQTRVSVDETRKAILRLLPGITFSSGRNYDSNSFLENQLWNEASAKISFNLFNIIAAPDNIHYAQTAEQVVEAKRLALRMAVLAQVHVSRNQFDSAVQQYKRADRLYQVETKLADTTARRQESDAQSVLERVASQTSAIAAELRRYQTFAQAQTALGRMQATLGQDPVPPTLASRDLDSVSKDVAARLGALEHGIEPATSRQPAAQAASAQQITAISFTSDEVFATIKPMGKAVAR